MNGAFEHNDLAHPTSVADCGDDAVHKKANAKVG